MAYLLGQGVRILAYPIFFLFVLRVLWLLIPRFIREGGIWCIKTSYKIVRPVGVASYKVVKQIKEEHGKAKALSNKESDKANTTESEKSPSKTTKTSHLKIVK